MRIRRTGALRNKGTKTIVPELTFETGTPYKLFDTALWNEDSKRLVIRPRYIEHSDGKTHHNYSIELTLEDISALISILGHAGSATDARLLRDHLSKDVPAIVKILACATGVAPVDIAEEPKKRKR